MKKKLVKLLSLTLVTAVLAASAAGCAKGKNSNGGEQTGGTVTEDTADKKGLPIVKDKLTLKFLSYSRADFSFSNDIPIFKELEKRTNIQLDWQLLPTVDAAQKFNLIMASGELPDLISYPVRDALAKYSQQGAFIVLDELIAKHAPNIKNVIDNPPFPIPNIKAEMKAGDGKIYTIPFITQVNTGAVFSIRQDWLDNLNLKVPETTEDFYNVLKAFKEKDPNGNGKPDEVPYSSSSGINGLTPLVNSFGAHKSYYVAKDNTIKFGPIEDSYREGLAFINKLIKEDLVDKEFLTINIQQFKAKVANNQVGTLFGWPASGMAASNVDVKKLDPKYHYVGMLPAKGPKGERFLEDPQRAVIARTAITGSNKHPVETIKYLDYLFSEEGMMLMNWGIEGEHYKMVGGKPQFTDAILKNPEGKDVATARALAGMQMSLPTIATLEPEKASATDPEIANVWEKYISTNTMWTLYPNLPLSEDQLSMTQNKVTEIKTYVDENIAKFMIGEKSLEEFPKFVEQIKKLGIDDVLKAYNEAYKKYNEFNK